MLLALSTGHKLGLGLVGATFILFALASSFLLPRYRPDFPGRWLGWFAVASIALFVAMIAAVDVFGREPAEAGAKGRETSTSASTTSTAAAAPKKVQVKESEFKIVLATPTLGPGSYEFDVQNTGKLQHDLVVDGPGVAKQGTPKISGGSSATLRVTLKAGEYELYCSIPGHKQLGMDLKLKVA